MMKDVCAERPPRIVGVIGGMGPLATVDFMQQLIALTPAASDQEHIPALVAQIPQVPDRVGAILRNTVSPLPQLMTSLQRLERAGAELLVMPCNTAHYWHAELARSTPLPFIHIVDAVMDKLAEQGLAQQTQVGLLATPATYAAGIFSSRIGIDSGMQFVAPDASDIQELLVPAIALVKSGRVHDAGVLLQTCIQRLRTRGIEKIVLGCTELPIALKAVGVAMENDYVDATAALAEATIKAALDKRDTPQR